MKTLKNLTLLATSTFFFHSLFHYAENRSAGCARCASQACGGAGRCPHGIRRGCNRGSAE